MATVEEVLAKIEGISKKVPDDFCTKWPELCATVDGLKTEVRNLREESLKVKLPSDESLLAIRDGYYGHLQECSTCRGNLGLLTEEEAEEKFKPKPEPKVESPKQEVPPPKPRPKVKVLKREELPASFNAYSAYGLEPERQADGTFIIRDKGKFAEIWGTKGEKAGLKFFPPGCSLKCEDPDNPASCKVVCED